MSNQPDLEAGAAANGTTAAAESSALLKPDAPAKRYSSSGSCPVLRVNRLIF